MINMDNYGRKEVGRMFYYCAKCTNIKNIPKADSVEHCELCDTVMQPVPKEYLMPNGSFFKSQEARKQLIALIQSSDTYDEEFCARKEEARHAVEEAERKRIETMNQKLEQEQFHMTCPMCGSRSVQRISAVGKYAKIGMFGILGADDLGKTWKCKVCGSKF